MSVDYSPAGLANLYTELGRKLTGYQRPDEVFDALVHTGVQTVPGARHAGISRGRNGRFSTAAATDDRVMQTDQIQYDLGSGPCVDAIKEDTVFNVGDLRSDERWPDFGRLASTETGILSMLSFRMFLEDDDDLVAGMNFYSEQPQAFDEPAETIGLLLTTHGALALAAATARERAHNLEKALKSSREIGVAMGVLMSQHKITRDQAFDLLRIASQHTNRKLAEIAGEVADTGQLSLPRPGSRPARRRD